MALSTVNIVFLCELLLVSCHRIGTSYAMSSQHIWTFGFVFYDIQIHYHCHRNGNVHIETSVLDLSIMSLC